MGVEAGRGDGSDRSSLIEGEKQKDRGQVSMSDSRRTSEKYRSPALTVRTFS